MGGGWGGREGTNTRLRGGQRRTPNGSRGACRPYLPVGDVDGQVDVPEGARADLPHQLVLAPDDEFGLGAAAARHGERGDRGRAGAGEGARRGRAEARRGQRGPPGPAAQLPAGRAPPGAALPCCRVPSEARGAARAARARRREGGERKARARPAGSRPPPAPSLGHGRRHLVSQPPLARTQNAPGPRPLLLHRAGHAGSGAGRAPPPPLPARVRRGGGGGRREGGGEGEEPGAAPAGARPMSGVPEGGRKGKGGWRPALTRP